jgi:hypothetical protein
MTVFTMRLSRRSAVWMAACLIAAASVSALAHRPATSSAVGPASGNAAFTGTATGRPAGTLDGAPIQRRLGTGARMRLLTEKSSFVLGEEVVVQLTIPALADGESTSARLTWIAAGVQDGEAPYSKGVDVSKYFQAVSAAGPKAPTRQFQVPVFVPWGAPGRFALRLSQENEPIDVVEVAVGKGWLEDGIIPSKQVYQVGETIEFTATLPENRYYSGHWSGPSVLLFPLEIEGKTVSKEEAIKMYSEGQLPASWLASIAKGAHGNPYDGGIEIVPGRYSVTKPVGDTKPFDARRPGRYELRLYDRGFDIPFERYVDLFFASREIVIEAVGATPSSLMFARLKPQAPVRPPLGTAKPPQNAPVAGTRVSDYEPLNELTLGEVFFVVAVFEAATSLNEPAERTVTLEWPVDGAKRALDVRLERKSPGVYVSVPLLPSAPGGAR